MINYGSFEAKIGETVYLHFPVYGEGDKDTGLVGTDFSKTFEHQGVVKTTDFAFSGVSEIGSTGDYVFSVALSLAGSWSLEVKRDSNGDVWRWEFDISTAEAEDITDLVLDITRGEAIGEMRVPLGQARKYRWRAPGDKSGLANVELRIYDDALAQIAGSPFAMTETALVGIYQTDAGVSPSPKGRYLMVPVAPSLGAQGIGRPLHLEVTNADAGTGIEPVTIEVVDGSDVPIADVGIAIYNSADTLQIASGRTDTNGLDGRFALAEGSYKVRLQLAGASFSNPYSITVAAGGGTFTLVGDPDVPNTPASASLCGVYGTITNGTGVGQSGIKVIAKNVTPPAGVGVTRADVTDTTDANGFFQVDLYRLGVYDIIIQSLDYRKRITVPNTPLYNLFP